MEKPILVFGKTGQLAQALQKKWTTSAVFIARDQADFMKPDSVLEPLRQYKPSVVVNTVAFTAVDLAEQVDQQRACLQVNSKIPGEIAKWCAQNKALMLHFSTDYVYQNLSSKDPHFESQPTGAVNFYGYSKLEGERAIQNSNCDHLIFRVSWLYSDVGKNFYLTIQKLAASRDTLQVVQDQWGYPTNVYTLADAVDTALTVALEHPQFEDWGVYNLVGPDFTNWYEFAQSIIEKTRKSGASLKVEKILPVTSSEWKSLYPQTADRPLNSRMSSEKFRSLFGTELPDWKEALEKL